MKTGIHPTNHRITITCACGNAFETLSTKEQIAVEICSKCHPFFTGKQKLVDTARRVEKFEEKIKKQAAITSTLKHHSKKEKQANRRAKKAAVKQTKESAKAALKAAKAALSE